MKLPCASTNSLIAKIGMKMTEAIAVAQPTASAQAGIGTPLIFMGAYKYRLKKKIISIATGAVTAQVNHHQ